MKTVLILIALSVFSSAAYAEGDPGYPGAVERGASRAGTFTANGVPYITAWVCDATAKPPKPAASRRPAGSRDGMSGGSDA